MIDLDELQALHEIEMDPDRGGTGWLAWCAEVEAGLGSSLDGNQALDGYSIDHAYEAWRGGMSADEYVSSVGSGWRKLWSR